MKACVHRLAIDADLARVAPSQRWWLQTTLEAELQMQLFERLPRACRLTESGVQIPEWAQRMETAAFGIARHARAHQAPLDAKVTLSAPPVLATHFLARHLAGLRADHPRIHLAVLAQPQQVSLSRREADIALRLVRPKESSNVTRRIGRKPFGLYAHRDYAASVAPPRLELHRLR